MVVDKDGLLSKDSRVATCIQIHLVVLPYTVHHFDYYYYHDNFSIEEVVDHLPKDCFDVSVTWVDTCNNAVAVDLDEQMDGRKDDHEVGYCCGVDHLVPRPPPHDEVVVRCCNDPVCDSEKLPRHDRDCSLVPVSLPHRMRKVVDQLLLVDCIDGVVVVMVVVVRTDPHHHDRVVVVPVVPHDSPFDCYYSWRVLSLFLHYRRQLQLESFLLPRDCCKSV